MKRQIAYLCVTLVPVALLTATWGAIGDITGSYKVDRVEYAHDLIYYSFVILRPFMPILLGED